MSFAFTKVFVEAIDLFKFSLLVKDLGAPSIFLESADKDTVVFLAIFLTGAFLVTGFFFAGVFADFVGFDVI